MTNGTAILVRLEDTELTLANLADDVRGYAVVDRDGQEVGEVNSLIVDQEERRGRLLEVGSGGFLGMGEQKVLIPVDAVTRVDDAVHIDKNRQHVATGPAYDPELTISRDDVADLYGYYGHAPFWGPGYIPTGFPFR